MNLVIKTSLEPMVRRLLRPLISLLIKNNIQIRPLYHMIKEVYVDVAASEYGKGGRPTNITRIALLTGIDRKEVKRIKEVMQNQSSQELTRHSGSLARVLSAWHQDSRYSNNGKPSALNVDQEFRELCKEYGGDITQTAILNELLRVSAVRALPDGRITALTRYYMPEQANHEAVARSLDVFYDVGTTLNYNLYRDETQSSRFEGRATNSFIPRSQAAEFKLYIEKKAQEFLEQVDQRLTQEEHRDNRSIENADQERIRLGIGLYLIEDDGEAK